MMAFLVTFKVPEDSVAAFVADYERIVSVMSPTGGLVFAVMSGPTGAGPSPPCRHANNAVRPILP